VYSVLWNKAACPSLILVSPRSSNIRNIADYKVAAIPGRVFTAVSQNSAVCCTNVIFTMCVLRTKKFFRGLHFR
jgi:hypothetical protein